MSKVKRKFMDVLGEPSDSDGDSDGEGSSEDEPCLKKTNAIPAKPASKSLKLEDLQKAGYQTGPSVLHIPAQAAEEPERDWGWGDGKAAKEAESPETLADRQALRHAVTTAVDESAAYTQKLLSHAEKMRAEKKAEKEAKAKQKSLSFKEKEKRKRETGKQSAGKNYVEEEKRIAREAGVYSGFDT